MNKSVCIVGLGYIGLPTAAILCEKGYNVHGVDVQESKIKAVNEGQSYINEPGLEKLISNAVRNNKLSASYSAKESDIFIIAVPTPFHEGYIPNIDYVMESVQSIVPYLKEDNMIIIESTIPVGTTKKIEKFIQKQEVDVSKIHIAHCPERVLPGNILQELKSNDRIVGGIRKDSTKKVADFYKTFVAGKILNTTDKTAEMAKLTENSFRDVNIAFANELSIICEKENIDIWELISLANKHPRVNILNPGPGVGGHCIAVDPWFIVSSNKKDANIIKKAREVNLYKTKWVAEKIKNRALRFETEFDRKPIIACMGLAYKADVDDCRESPSIEIIDNLIKDNFDVIAVEPNIKTHDYINLVDIDSALQKADIIVWLVQHKEFKSINIKKGLDFCGILLK